MGWGPAAFVFFSWGVKRGWGPRGGSWAVRVVVIMVDRARWRGACCLPTLSRAGPCPPRPCRRPRPLASLQGLKSAAGPGPQGPALGQHPGLRSPSCRPALFQWEARVTDALTLESGGFPTQQSLVSEENGWNGVSWKLHSREGWVRGLTVVKHESVAVVQVHELLWILCSDYPLHPHRIRNGRWVVLRGITFSEWCLVKNSWW